jgi:hypothetical protein
MDGTAGFLGQSTAGRELKRSGEITALQVRDVDLFEPAEGRYQSKKATRNRKWTGCDRQHRVVFGNDSLTAPDGAGTQAREIGPAAHWPARCIIGRRSIEQVSEP